MKSTLKIALGEHNEPVIQFQVTPSEDLRDHVCKQFLEKLRGSSNLCSVDITQSGEGHLLSIYPKPKYDKAGIENSVVDILGELQGCTVNDIVKRQVDSQKKELEEFHKLTNYLVLSKGIKENIFLRVVAEDAVWYSSNNVSAPYPLVKLFEMTVPEKVAFVEDTLNTLCKHVV